LKLLHDVVIYNRVKSANVANIARAL